MLKSNISLLNNNLYKINMILEAPVDDIHTTHNLVKKGVNRLEICSDLLNDGLTPTKEFFLECKQLNVTNFVMIRPKKGDFTVSDREFDLMKKQIADFKTLGADGFVLGILNDKKEVDTNKVETLVQLAKPLPVTFHKAIDVTKDILNSAKSLLNTGITRILTSGGKPTVLEGIDTIKKMHGIVKNKITLVAGGKVTFDSLSLIKKELPFCEYHGKNIVKI